MRLGVRLSPRGGRDAVEGWALDAAGRRRGPGADGIKQVEIEGRAFADLVAPWDDPPAAADR